MQQCVKVGNYLLTKTAIVLKTDKKSHITPNYNTCNVK